MDVEICINSESSDNVRRDVVCAWRGGAARIELCSDMHLAGLTPAPEHIALAREAFQDRPGLMVMIRPRGGDFCYSSQEIDVMQRQIEIAATRGADGVVAGVLRKMDASVDAPALHRLLQTAKNNGLAFTFHRAIDATPDPLRALDELVQMGVDRVLSSGVSWGAAGGALQGSKMLNNMLARAQQVEIIIGGGVGPANAGRIVARVAAQHARISLHAYSSVLQDGAVSVDAVRALVDAGS